MLWSVWIGALAVLSPSSWEAPADCGSRTAFDERVEALLPDGADAGEMTATVQVRRDGELWRLTLRMSGPDGDETRTFEADRCLVTVEAAALVVAMRASVPDAVEVPVPPNPPPQPEVPESGPTAVVKEPIERPGETPVAAPVPGPPPVAVEPRELGGWLDAGAGVGFGLLPNLGASVLLRGGLGGARWRVGGSVEAQPSRTQTPAARAAGGRFDLVGAGLLGCFVPRWGDLEVPVCGVGQAGAVRAEGAGPTGRVRWRPWFAAGATLGFAWWAWPRLAPFFEAQGAVAVVRPRFTRGAASATQLGRVGGQVWVGLRVDLRKRRKRRDRSTEPRTARDSEG